MGKKLSNGMICWVTVRNEDTGELLNKWSYTDSDEALGKKLEQEEALDPPGIQTEVSIEVLPAGMFPEKVKKRGSY